MVPCEVLSSRQRKLPTGFVRRTPRYFDKLYEPYKPYELFFFVAKVAKKGIASK